MSKDFFKNHISIIGVGSGTPEEHREVKSVKKRIQNHLKGDNHDND